MDRIELTSFEFETIIGILPLERDCVQPIAITLSLGLDLEKAGTIETLTDSIDYARVKDMVVFVTREGRWHLIEALALALCRVLLFGPTTGEERAPILEVDIGIKKPRILAPVAVPGVRLNRTRDWFAVDEEHIDIGVVLSPLAHTLNSWVWSLQLAPGAKWEVPEGMKTMVLSGGVEAETESFKNGNIIPSMRAARPVKALAPTLLLLVGHNAS
jgi:FolB domain-containing protein